MTFHKWAIRFRVLRGVCRESLRYELPPRILASGFGSVWTACSSSR